MDKSLIVGLVLLFYFLIPLGISLLVFVANRKREGQRPPVDFALRRGPGETLRRKIAKGDEDIAFQLLVFGATPWAISWLLVSALPLAGKQYTWPALILAFLVLGAGLVTLGRKIYRHFTDRRNNLLGYLGERAVGEWLDTLPREYRVFHDVPVDEGKGAFNLDHVVVGPTGLFAIETKTRRKGRAREGFSVYEVAYDGRQLIWPWGEDTNGLQQATNEAEWLTKWIRQMTGLNVVANPVLALPGWWVVNRAKAPVAVQNPKNLPSYILGKGTRTLDPQQIDLIARQLDSRCRDVRD